VIIAGVIKRHKTAVIGTMVLLAVIVAGTAAAWFLTHRPPQPTAELTQKRLTFNSSDNPIRGAGISPDGKYLAYSDAAGIHVQLLSTGDERPIPRPAGVPSEAVWGVDSWFPDCTQLLADTAGPGAQHSIWTVSVLGQSARELREGAGAWEVSPDGTRIAFSPLASGVEGFRELWVMGSQGDNPQKVLALGEGEWFSRVHWSPDGQRLAFIRTVVDYHSDVHGASIETCDLKGARRALVVAEPNPEASLEDFCWLPDGRIAYSGGEPSDIATSNLWQVSTDSRSGTATGQPRRITRWAGFYIGGLSATADGKRLVFLRLSYQGQVYLSELAAGGVRMNPPRRLTNGDVNDYPIAWMPDSKAIFFRSWRNGAWGLFKQAIDQETAESVVSGAQHVDMGSLSPDGAWILYHEAPRQPSNERRIMRLPIVGGVPQFVMEVRVVRGVLGYGCARRPGGLCVALEVSQDEKQLTLTAFDPLKGRGKVLRTIDKDPTAYYDGSRLSPDGATYAIPENGEGGSRIRLLSLAGGSDHELTLKGWRGLSDIEWSLDGKGLYCGSRSAQASTLFYVDLRGDARVLWQAKGPYGAFSGIPSPDGRYLAIGSGVMNSSVWMLEGF
jgi:Tol biopolymer transport system component